MSLGSCDDELHSTFAYLQTDADFSGFIIGEARCRLAGMGVLVATRSLEFERW